MSDLAAIKAEAEASAVKNPPGDVLLACILGIFTCIGWIWGRMWFSLHFVVVATKYGYYSGAKIPPEQRGKKQVQARRP
jgi:hypothetical protein